MHSQAKPSTDNIHSVSIDQRCFDNQLIFKSEEADRFLGLHEGYLAKDRCTTAKVPFVKFGRRAVRYRREDLEAFLESKIFSSTSEYRVKQNVGP